VPQLGGAGGSNYDFITLRDLIFII